MIGLLMGLALSSQSQAVVTSSVPEAAIELRGTLQRYLMNPRGEVDGFILTDGTQVKFPSQMSSKLTSVASPKDDLLIKGFKENSRVFSAESITNTKTSQTIAESTPYLNTFEREDAYGNMMAPEHKGMKSQGKKHLGLKKISISGKIKTQLFDHRARVVGVILNDDSIVHFGKHVQEESTVNVDIGQTLTTSGYGTENSYGKSIETEKISNK